jgi:hypothetical protein
VAAADDDHGIEELLSMVAGRQTMLDEVEKIRQSVK